MKDVVAVVDLQFGSTGKGQIAGTVGRQWQPDTVVCANGPNAGHTYKWWTTDGKTDYINQVMHTVMPVTAVLPSVRNILLGPGAVVDPERLALEIEQSEDLLAGKRILIHPNAAVVGVHHREREKSLVRVGSTMKGTAEAVIEKMQRGEAANIARTSMVLKSLPNVCIDEAEYNKAVDSSDKLLVEGAQGASLSIHSRFYPHTTSRDVSISQIWADCRLPCLEGDIQVIGVCRTYPIRVANRYTTSESSEVRQIGYSGGCYSDQQEISWSDIGREPELTTVTRLPRRLFTFSTQQILEAVRYNGPTSIALTFCDYLPSHNAEHPKIPEGMMPYPVGPGERLSPCVSSHMRRIEAAAGRPVEFLSFGSTDRDIYSANVERLVKMQLPWE